MKQTSGDVIEIGGTKFTVVRGNSGSIPATFNTLKNQPTDQHAEARLFSFITTKFGGAAAKVKLAVQNNSIRAPGFCAGCSNTVKTFATSNPKFVIEAYKGSTRATP